ncbi:hypothetical protein C8R47DRAFT_174891 [Mycena vitilis]|nr:hypothetical protein C8R47DRAFT_174891 [Mycena vitilis]
MADTLEPIVIPPLKADKHFTCSGSGLRYEEQERVSADSLRSLLLPSGGRNGISDRDRSKAWWGAQALFYGFKYTKTMNIAQVRAQLEDALRDKSKGLRVPQDILDLEFKCNKEFRELNAQVRDKAGMGTKRKREAEPAAPKPTKSNSKAADASAPATRAPKVKAKAEPSPDAVPKKKARVKQPDDVSDAVEDTKPRTKQTARKTTKPAKQGEAKPRTKQTAKKTVKLEDDLMDLDEPHAPRTKTAAKRTVPTVKREDDWMDLDEPHASRTKTTAKRSVPVPAGAVASSSSMPAPAPRTKQTARRGNPFPSPPARSTAPRADPVSGYWVIDCPAISSEWEYMEDFSLNIIGRGASLEGEFELGIINGLLRADRVEQRPNGAYATVYWAGKENDGPVCTPNAGRSGYIKFTGDRLKGKLNNVPACGDVEFEGEWVGGASQIRAGWDNYNEAAYERANKSRWGGSRWGGWS